MLGSECGGFSDALAPRNTVPAKVRSPYFAVMPWAFALGLGMASCEQHVPMGPATTEEGISCVIDAAYPWFELRLGSPDDRPHVVVLPQDQMRVFAASQTGNRDMLIYGLQWLNEIWIWEGVDVDTWHGQHFIVHELAHWFAVQQGLELDESDADRLALAWLDEDVMAAC